MKANTISQTLFREAVELIPGGVNSPVRAFKSVGLAPRFLKSGMGSKIVDEDGNEFIDYVCSWGPLILGHAHPEVLVAIEAAMRNGTSFGAPTRREIEMARTIRDMVPSVEMVRLVNSGTEALMSAIRLARGYTGRDRIIKFSGCYHGHSDSLLAKAGSGAATFALPDSLGVPSRVVEQTVVVPFNNLEAVRIEIEENPNRLAAIVVEPVAGNMGVVPPKAGFLEGLQELCTRDGALLIFDEVISGFRVAPGGAQQLYDIQPDLTCMGKIIGGGLPVAAFGGPKEIMESLAPVGGVYQAGTLSGNPLAVAGGLATLRILQRDNPYPELEKKAALLADGLEKILHDKSIPHTINRVGSMLSLFFHPGPVASYEEALHADKDAFVRFFSNMLDRGIYLAPSPFEAWFVSAAHSYDDIHKTLDAARESI
ncbi:MAG TPA: glutamate-1-semialdehyde 2,1-aminomutase [Desulfomonilaceae bacterium]|nr:glutamate-1-semialdehyde 2,1-aminomutase [Desulfomonilaceae bacterium]